MRRIATAARTPWSPPSAPGPTLAWLLVLLGCVHVFIAAPQKYVQLYVAAMWFIAGGLVLWFAGALNLLRIHDRHPDTQKRLIHAAANTILLAYVIAFPPVQGSWHAPSTWLLVTVIALLALASLQPLFPRTGVPRKPGMETEPTRGHLGGHDSDQ